MLRRSQIIAALSLATVAASALTTGCGLGGEPPFAGRRITDVAPFFDLGPLTFCDGAAHLGAPASTRGGLCATGRERSPCAGDGDCKSRERCTCDGCQVARCDRGEECSATQVCTFAESRCDRPCASDPDCAPGEHCLPGAGVCRASCTGDKECQGGEVCTSGLCAVTACGSDGDCTSGCAIQRVPGRLREPSPLIDGSQVILWIERIDASGAAIWRAVSSDGIAFRFDPPHPVIAPGPNDGKRSGAPSVMRSADGYLAAFADGQGALRRATSRDGIVFTVDPLPLAIPTLGWDASGLDAPSLATAPGGGLLLYFGTLDRSAVGLLESADGVHFNARPAPVLTPAMVRDPLLWRGVDAIASPFAEPALTVDGKPYLRVYFAARGRESGAAIEFGKPVAEAANFSIGEASTLDGRTLVPWPFDPAFDRVAQFVDHTSELDPALVTIGEVRRLYYRGASADESTLENLGVAQDPPPPN